MENDNFTLEEKYKLAHDLMCAMDYINRAMMTNFSVCCGVYKSEKDRILSSIRLAKNALDEISKRLEGEDERD
jgi:hypothetical protein